ncbi:MAG: DUF4339 domain-containing protein [Acidobacteria bacterium]|nr:DUF4339 domain-containing protein [Acidobacteriota bacterium]
MYYLIGADGKSNGPLSAADIHQWIAEGRASKYSRVRRADEEGWQALGAIAELLPPAPAPEEGEAAGTPAMATETGLAAEPPALDAGRCVARGWTLVRDHPLILIGSTIVAWSLMLGIAYLPRPFYLLGSVVNGPLLGGLYAIHLGCIRGLAVRPDDLFSGFRMAFVPLVLAGLLCGALTTIGLLLFVVPGIYLLVCFMFVIPLVMDKRLEPWAALKVSRAVVHRQWWTAFALLLIVALVALAGLLAFGIGVLVAGPVATAALMYAYEDLFGD